MKTKTSVVLPVELLNNAESMRAFIDLTREPTPEELDAMNARFHNMIAAPVFLVG